MSALSHSQMQSVLVNSTAEWMGGNQEVKEKKTRSVLPGGMLMAGLTLSRVLHVLVGFSAGRICLVHSSSTCITGKLDCG